MAAPSPRNDLVKNCRVHPTHWLISTQAGAEPPRRGRARAPRGRHGSHARARRRDARGVHARAAGRDRAARAAARQTSSAAARGPAHLRRREESRGVIWLFCGFFSSVRAPRARKLARSGLPLAELASSLATCLACRRSLEECPAPEPLARAKRAKLRASGCNKTLANGLEPRAVLRRRAGGHARDSVWTDFRRRSCTTLWSGKNPR